MKTFLAALVFVGLAVLLLGVNIFFFRRPFPDGEISTNPEMRKRGIKCAQEEELEMLEEASSLQDISHMPARVKCAVLGWRTLEQILEKGEGGEVTTEQE